MHAVLIVKIITTKFIAQTKTIKHFKNIAQTIKKTRAYLFHYYLVGVMSREKI